MTQRETMIRPPLASALGARVQAAHEAAQASARTAIEHAVECGELLLQAKAECGHGGWLDWIAANTTISPRQAQRYMRAAAHREELAANASAATHLEGTMAFLASPHAAEREVAAALSEPPVPPFTLKGRVGEEVPATPEEVAAQWRSWPQDITPTALGMLASGQPRREIARLMNLPLALVNAHLGPPPCVFPGHEQTPMPRRCRRRWTSGGTARGAA